MTAATFTECHLFCGHNIHFVHAKPWTRQKISRDTRPLFEETPRLSCRYPGSCHRGCAPIDRMAGPGDPGLEAAPGADLLVVFDQPGRDPPAERRCSHVGPTRSLWESCERMGGSRTSAQALGYSPG